MKWRHFFGTLAALLSAASTFAQSNPRAPFTEEERRQGYSNRTLLAKPKGAAIATEVGAAERREGRQARRVFPRLGQLRIIETAPGESIAQAITQLRASGRYEFVEPDYIKKPHAVPNDPRFPEQWHLRNTGEAGGQAGADIAAAAAWEVRTDAPEIIVAVIDSGARLSHEDLAGNLWINPGEIPSNGLDDDNNGYVDDVHGINSIAARGSPASGNPLDDVGHGTVVVGAVGAVGNNAVGISGVAWKAKLMALKFDDAEQSASISNQIECLDYALAKGAHIVNISYGNTHYSQAEYEALQRLRDAGIIVVTSAGNEGTSNDVFAHYPSGYALDNILTVAATDRRDGLATFSNYGSGIVDLAAPGVAILSTSFDSNASYEANDGTSFSAPLVAGALALVKARFPGEDYRSNINRLLGSVDARASLTGRVQSGGRLNLARALTSVSNRPFNDDFAARGRLEGTALTVRNHSRHATAELGEPALGASVGATLWWSWTAPRSGPVVVDAAGSGFDAVAGVFTGDNLSTLTSVVPEGGTATKRISFSAAAGTTYQIAVGGNNSATGPILLALGFRPANDAIANATQLTGLSYRVDGFNAGAIEDPTEPLAAAGARGRSVWYKWTPPATGTYALSVFAYGFDAVGAVYVDSASTGLVKLKAFSTGDINEPAQFRAVAGVSYYFQIDSFDAGAGAFDLVMVDGATVTAVWPVNSSPAFSPASSTLFMLDSYGFLLYLNLSTFAFDYTVLDGTVDVQTPALGPDGAVFIGDDLGYLHAFNPNGSPRWRKDLGYVSVTSSPALGADGTIYVHTDDGYLHAVLPDGGQKWRAVVPGDSYSSPSIASDGTLYIGSSDEHLYAIAPADGKVKWKFKADGEVYASPAIGGDGTLYFGTLNGKFHAVTPAGAARWTYSTSDGISSSAAIATNGDLYFGCYDGGVYALSPEGALRWKYLTDDDIRASSPVVANDGSIYIGSYDGYLHVINPDGSRKRVYATGAYIRSSPLLVEGSVAWGSGDSRVYVADVGLLPASSPWPMHRQNSRRTGRRLLASPPVITTHPASRTVALNGATTLAVQAEGGDSLAFQWYRNGVPIAGATQSVYAISQASAAQAGEYTVVVSTTQGSVASVSALVGVSLPEGTRLSGPGTEVLSNAVVANKTFDQILLQGSTATVRADPGQILRMSFIDLSDDIVQVEFSGAGSLTVSLESFSGPALPALYNQDVPYVKGQPSIVVAGADATTNLTVFSVGRGNAVNQALFRDVSYDGFADVAFISITSTDGQFGFLRTANVRYAANRGLTGVYAPGVKFNDVVFVSDINAADGASPVLQLGGSVDVRVTGGDLLQSNGRPVQVSGLTQLKFGPGSNSHNVIFPAQKNRAKLEENGADVTLQLVMD